MQHLGIDPIRLNIENFDTDIQRLRNHVPLAIENVFGNKPLSTGEEDVMPVV